MFKQQYTGDYGMYPEESNSRQIDLKKVGIIAIAAVFLIFIVSYIIFSSSGGNESLCGNGKCDAGETCLTCKKDCGCQDGTRCNLTTEKCDIIVTSSSSSSASDTSASKESGSSDDCAGEKNCWDTPKYCKCEENEYCSEDTKLCTAPVCGNGVCELYESTDTCCLDCPCYIAGSYCNQDTKQCEQKTMQLSDEEALSIGKAYFESRGIDAADAGIGAVTAYGNTLIKVVYVTNNNARIYIGVTEEGEVIEIPTN